MRAHVKTISLVPAIGRGISSALALELEPLATGISTNEEDAAPSNAPPEDGVRVGPLRVLFGLEHALVAGLSVAAAAPPRGCHPSAAARRRAAH